MDIIGMASGQGYGWISAGTPIHTHTDTHTYTPTQTHTYTHTYTHTLTPLAVV